MSLAQIVDQFSRVKALVCGDAISDVYHFGRVDRICPEAPAPIFVEDIALREQRRGGADNVAHQLDAFGCQVTCLFSNKRSAKHRYFAGHHLLFRQDFDKRGSPPVYANNIDQYDVVVLSDYNKGFLTEEFCQSVIRKANGYGIPVVVDPKGSDWTKYNGCTAICPNSKEFAGWQTGGPFDILCVKRSEHGIELIRKGRESITLPARARTVFDVTGAGDVVVGAVAATLGCSRSALQIEQACQIGVIASGFAVERVGTTVCPKEELIKLL